MKLENITLNFLRGEENFLKEAIEELPLKVWASVPTIMDVRFLTEKRGVKFVQLAPSSSDVQVSLETSSLPRNYISNIYYGWGNPPVVLITKLSELDNNECHAEIGYQFLLSPQDWKS